jgi:tetratricopeptide (TPR) repeat protein
MSHGGHVPELDLEELPASDAMKRAIATMVMTITLVGTVFAFLQSRANNMEARAARHSSSAALESMASVIEAGNVIGRDNLAYNLANDHLNLEFEYEFGDRVPLNAYTRSLSEVESSVAAEYNRFSELTTNPKYKKLEVGQDYLAFREDQYESSYEETEFAKQYAIERDGWFGKGETYIAVITVLAFALFLLGLSSHISPHALKPFVWAAGVIALVATVWGGTTFFRPVEEPTPEAIHHFVEGTQAFNTAQTVADYEHVIELLSHAIEERDGYFDAHLLRGNAYFDLDFFNPKVGPQGSEEALNDWLIALEDNPTDWVATGNVGAVHYWLGNYQEAYEWSNRALELQPHDPVLLINRLEARIALDADIELGNEIADLRARFAELPGWLRDSVLQESYGAMELVVEHRPEVADKEAELLEALKRMHHEIAVSLLMTGDPNPPPVDASVDELHFRLSPDNSTLKVEFDYDGMEAGQEWLYRTYINNQFDPNFSTDLTKFGFTVPSGGVILTFQNPAGFKGYRFRSGATVRTEIFVEGNLLNAGEFEIP